MIDYIQWLLEEAEEEAALTLEWRAWSLAGRARKTAADAPEKTARAGQAGPPHGEEADRRRPFPRRERAHQPQGAPAAALPLPGRARIGLRERRENGGEPAPGGAAVAVQPGEGLFRQAARARRLAGFVEQPRLDGDGWKRNETAAVQGAGDMRSLDRAFQRDARRYDGGFPLL